MKQALVTLWNMEAHTRMSNLPGFLRQGMTEVVVVKTGLLRRANGAKLQSSHPHQHTYLHSVLQACLMPFLSSSQQCQSTEGVDVVVCIRWKEMQFQFSRRHSLLAVADH